MTIARVIDRRQLSKDTFLLLVERNFSDLKAGQCFSIGAPEIAINREYSIYSGADEPFLSFLIRRVEGGSVSTYLSTLNSGALVDLWGPFGSFCLDEVETLHRKLFFIASGTGIAPFHSFIRTYPKLDYFLLHGIRLEEEMYDIHDYPKFRYQACVSQANERQKRSRVTDFLRQNDLETENLYYLCGNRQMINDSIDILRQKGVAGSNIFTETFF